jgi:hypothetical protein
VRTDLTVSDAEALFSLVQGVSPASIEHVSIDNTNFLYDCGYPYSCGAYYLYAHDRTYASMGHFIKNIFVPPSARAEKTPVTFYDASGRRLDASGRWAKTVAMLGLQTSDGGAVARQVATQVIDESGGKGAGTARWLASFFGVPVTAAPPTPTPSPGAVAATPPPASGITVILGTAEEQSFLSDPGVGI